MGAVQRKKLRVGDICYTFYFEPSKNGSKMLYYTGILTVKVKKITNTEWGAYFDFELIDSTKSLGTTIRHNIHNRLQDDGWYGTTLFDTKEDAELEHDIKILEFANNQSSDNRESTLKKLINQKLNPGKSRIEIESMNWFNNLTKQEQNYVHWIKDFKDNL